MTPLNDKIFFSFEEAFNIPSKFIGGKAKNLSRLVNYGFKVPIGGVLSSDAYDHFLSENNLHETINNLKESVNIENYLLYEEELSSIRNKILAGSFPINIRNEIVYSLEHSNISNKPLAIRSSITCEDSKDASFAGIFESFLNITGIDNILNNIKQCYASIWTIKSISYLIKMNLLDEEIKGSVIVMEMINAKSAGVAFSCDPQIGNSNTLVINANYGLGESVVGGLIEPDEYRLCYKYSHLRITKKKIGKKQGVYIPAKDGGTKFISLNSASNKDDYNFKSQNQVLDDSFITELALIVLRVHEVFGGEEYQDIEWVYNGKSFFLVQVRPVTVYANYTYSSLKNKPQIWSNANFKEVMPEVHSHLSWNIIKDILETMLIAPIAACNYKFGEDFMRARLYNGRPYLNLSVLQWETFDAFGISPQEYNERIGGHQPEIKITQAQASSKLIKKNIRQIHCFLHMLSNSIKSKKIFDNVIKNCNDLQKLNLSKLSNSDLIQTFYNVNNIALEYAPTALLILPFLDPSLPKILQA